MNKTHRVKKKDRGRIDCLQCQKPADVCEHVEWNTGNTTGISFFYYCDVCFDEVRRSRAERIRSRATESVPDCPIRYLQVEKHERGRRFWVPVVIPDLPELNSSVFAIFIWLGLIPRPNLEEPK